MSSRSRQLSYPRGSFSVITGPHRGGHGGSLGPAFAPGILSARIPVRPAFALTLYTGFLTRLSRPLSPPDIFSGGCRPSQTTHLSMSRRSGKWSSNEWAVFHGRLHNRWRGCFEGSCLRSTFDVTPQRQAVVKLHGVFFTRWKSLVYAPAQQVHRTSARDSGDLVHPFMQVAN